MNSSIVSESNRLPLLFLPEYSIWNLSSALFFAEEDNQIVSFSSNIRTLDGFTYYCIGRYGSDKAGFRLFAPPKI